MERLNLKPTHKPVQNYYEALRQFKTIGVAHEGAVRSAFQTLLEHCGRQFGWKLVPEWQIKRNHGHPLRVDGALVDEYRLTHGFWEAKDTDDDLIYNDFLTLSGIPPEVFEYRLGNRSALEWIIDQYQVSTDKRGGITNDPNRAGDPQYIVRLIGQVLTVSLETVKLVISLANLSISADIDT